MNKWQFWIDRGGTFTDVVAISPGGTLQRTKLLSEDPSRSEDAAIHAIRTITDTPQGALPPCELRIGTTVATNALLERKGARVALAITAGFEDALRIGSQERPELFARQIVLPDPIYDRVIGIEERVLADGTVEQALDKDRARWDLAKAKEDGIDALAICLMHGYRHTAHEEALAAIARDLGFAQISVSHSLAPLIKLISRGDTTVLDAYVSPPLRDYTSTVAGGLGDAGEALFMQSNGGLTAREQFHGKDAILSGPAGGIVGMAATAEEAGFAAVVGFDMGGTSTDVSWYSGQYERDGETRLEGVRIAAPMMRIHTVASGGGSICRFEAGRFHVGPESAGAFPGPACYRNGGPLTVTDCNLALGKLQAAHFPPVFGPDGNLPPDRDIVMTKLASLCDRIEAETGRKLSPMAAAEGFIAIAVQDMAQAIKAISIRRGHDIAGAALAAFGGAGGQHACLVAEALGVDVVQCHPLASVLSAYGMGLADRRAMREATLALELGTESAAEIAQELDMLARDAGAELTAQGVAADAIAYERSLQPRPAGTENTLEIAFGAPDDMAARFREGWRERFGFEPEGAIIVATARVEAVFRSPERQGAPLPLPGETQGAAQTIQSYLAGQSRDIPLFRRPDLAAGFQADGPALVVDDVSTIVVEPGWCIEVDAIGNVLLRRTGEARRRELSTERDPVRTAIMGALFMGIAEEMGAALQASASSVNIRERLDFSCAIFDRDGNLIANAPHMPVHLGSMGESVRTVARRRGEDGRGIRKGDAYALNAPYDGGTHLPDVTVVLPVFAGDDASEPAWWAAARGHHADIGGVAPGSMPAGSTTVTDEGILLDNVLLVDEGRFREAEMRDMLGSGPYPARDPDRNIADLKAQLAACIKGASELNRLADAQSRAVVDAYMGHVMAQAEEAVRALLDRLDDGNFAYEMDDGSIIRLAVTIDREAQEAMFDFTGTSGQHAGNFNAPVPIVKAAVLYAIRTMIDGDVPMNEGCLAPIRLIVPEGSMLNPRSPAAVVAGNVETSQVVTDTIFGALGAMAGAQGTMNNFTFGNADYQYYETIAGGSGAGPLGEADGFDGADAVQTHMTNSRLTDPEMLESRFPVVLERFAIRRGSGGPGRWHGGDGIIRRIRFLEPMEAGILSNRRRVAPFGLAGGEPGATGENIVVRADGLRETLASCACVEMQPGDAIEIRTPGGGGYRKKD